MFGRRKHNDTPIDGEASVESGVGNRTDTRRRYGGRGWGPFSGTQLTVIIVAIVVMVMLPVGAWAVVSGSNVFVTDATSGVRAHLTSKGELETHLNQTLSVTGAVTATQTPPSKEYHAQTYAITVGCVDIAVPPAGYAIVITSVTMDTMTANSYTVMSRFNGADCAGSPSSHATTNQTDLGQIGSVTVPYPSGMAIPSGSFLTAQVFGDVSFDVNGYLVPMSLQCTSPNAC